MRRWLSVMAVGLLVSPTLVWAQAAPAAAAPPINSLLALLINTAGTLLIVQLGKTYVIPQLRTTVPWLLPVLAVAVGPVVALAQTWLGQKLGYPVDLSPLLAAFSGAAAVAVNQTVKGALPDPASRTRKLLG